MNGSLTPPVNAVAFLQDQLRTPPEDSKKWKMAIIGLKGLSVAFFVGVAAIIFRPEQAGQFATLVQIAMTAWGGIIGIYLGAQGSVEFKATSALSTAHQVGNPAPITTPSKTVEQGTPGAPEIKPFSAPANTAK